MAQPDRGSQARFLSERYSPDFLEQALLARSEWHPYPLFAEREAWLALPESVRRVQIARGEEALAQVWPDLPATVYLEFSQTGNRSHYEAPYFQRRNILCSLLLAECLEGGGRFVAAAVDAIWSICEESSWCIPAHIGAQVAGSGLPDTREPVVDLFAAETAALLAWTGFLLGPALDTVSPIVMERIQREVKNRVLNPALKRDDFWWMGFSGRGVNNWNPWINSNWLAAVLLCESDRKRRQAAVYKILESLDRFISPYPKDGGCDEGPGYWGRAGASLFDCLELLHSATSGKLDVYSEPLIQEIGRFICRTHIAGEYYVNFADAPARLRPEAMLVFRYGQRIGDQCMMDFGAWLAQETDLLHHGFDSASPGRVLPALFGITELSAVKTAPPLLREAWLSEIQVLTARDQAGTDQGFYLAAKGGHNDESHNHNDVGHFIVYRDGKPLIVDAGVETYTRKTFSPQRYEIWTMQSAYHCLPTIGGLMQVPGRDYAAREVQCRMEDRLAQLTLDLAGAYPPETHLRRWLRTVTLYRGQSVDVVDDFSLESPVSEILFNLITPCRIVEKPLEHTITKEAGHLILDEAPLPGGQVTGTGQVIYDAARLQVTCEEIPINDERLGSIWGERLTRIIFRLDQPPLDGKVTLRIL